MTGTRPSTGVPRNCSTSCWVLSVLSSASIANASAMPVPSPIISPSSRFWTGFGRIGTPGTIARSSTRTLFVFIGPVMSISFCRVAMIPYILSSCSAERWSGLYSTSIFDSSMASFFCCSMSGLSDRSLSSSSW